MCGIAGLMTFDGKPPRKAVLDAFATALTHRGPDGEGRHVSANIGMVQRRLAIIDLETGDQPLYDDAGNALIANGEVYNYRELRTELGESNFSTLSDCEPPLNLYRRDGLNFAKSLRGMYSIAIHDPAQEQLILARDPFGIKPLYFAETSHGFAFASEPQAICAAGLMEAEINDERLDELLQLQFTCGDSTIFKGIERVKPGETLLVRQGRIIERVQLAALPEGPSRELSLEAAIEELDSTLEDSVTVHQRSDVPYGLFLSGGIDSSAVLALMARLNEKPVQAYTVGFTHSSVADEREHARELAKLVGADHIEVEFNESDFWSTLPQIAAAMDDPAADYAILPTWKLAREAAKDLKVVLSGEGGDELFGGYGRYRRLLRPWWRAGRTIRARGTFDRLKVLKENPRAWRDSIAFMEASGSSSERTKLQIAQETDCRDWLPNDLLTKLDRCLMAHGLEGRTPFLDREVAAKVFLMQDRLKIANGQGKWVLRQWLNKVMPQAKPFSRKRGFTVPVAQWISDRGSELAPMVSSLPAIARICHPSAVERIFKSNDKRAGFAAWTLLFFALWHRRHIEGIMPDGDVFELLSIKA
jgi:asparagine synthase (glutamine-hydrolysing)